MKNTKIKGKKNLEIVINKVRLILTKTYELNGHTDEVIKLSQELDKYIFLAQLELLELNKSEKDKA